MTAHVMFHIHVSCAELTYARLLPVLPPPSPAPSCLANHVQAGVELNLSMPGRDAIIKNKLKVSVNACWGDISLVQAQIDSLAEVLRRCPNVTHIGLGSGHDVPLQLMR